MHFLSQVSRWHQKVYSTTPLNRAVIFPFFVNDKAQIVVSSRHIL